jgi:Tfp pilus assembly protein PilO
VNIVRLKQFKEAEADVVVNKNDLLQKIPREKNQSNIIRDLRSLATNTGFSFTQIAFSEIENKAIEAKEIRASFVIEGPKNNVVNFLTSVENNKRFMGIENINVQTSIREGEEIANVSVTLYAFYQR